MKYRNLILALCFCTLFACSTSSKQPLMKSTHPEGTFTLTEISGGLPTEELWRQNVVFYDVNNDGFSDIITPPPRKAKPENRRPFIFVWDNETSVWIESDYKFPEIKGYDYGGVAVGDINNDGFFDIALANHSSRIMVLLNDKNNSFTDMPFSPGTDFYSRTIKLADMNDDGWLDIVALSEAPFVEGYVPKGILLGMNVEGQSWNISFIKESFKIQGSFMNISDYNGDGEKDIALAPLTMKADDQKLIFFGKDGNYNEFFSGALLLNYLLPFITTSGDYNGDSLDELVFLVSQVGTDSNSVIRAFDWQNNALVDMSDGLSVKERPFVMTSNDFDFDGKDELLLMSSGGLHIFKYYNSAWKEVLFKEMDYEFEIRGIYDINSVQWADNSYLIVYNLGRKNSDINGLRGLILKWQKS